MSYLRDGVRALALIVLLTLATTTLVVPAAAQVGSVQKIDAAALSSTIASGDRFGYATVSPGDVDNDGIPDLVVGAPKADGNDGAIYVLLLDAQGGVKAETKISGTPGAGNRFGSSVAHVGDLDRNGYPDIAVGAPNLDGSSESLRGGVTILFLEYDFQAATTRVINRQFIGENAGGFGDLGERSFFGRALSGLGDVDGDGVNDLAVGGSEGLGLPGAAWILLLNSDGTVKSFTKTPSAGSAEVSYGDAVSGIGDLNGDGIPDVAVGVPFAPDGGGERGLVRILFLAADGTVTSTRDVRNPEVFVGDGSGADGDSFGKSITALRDVNSDGVLDVGVGTYRDDDGARDTGAFWILYLNDDGTVQASQKISAVTGGFSGTLEGGDQFGWAAAAIDDVNRDGRLDVAVGAPIDDGTGSSQGAVWVLFGNDDLLPQGTPGLPYVEGFETNGLGTRYLAPGRFDGNSNNYFRRVVGDFTYSGSIPGAIDGPPYEGYVNFEGDNLWAGENVDGINSDGSGEKTLTLQAVDVSGASAVRFTGRFGANYNENLGSTFDSADDPSQGITTDSLVVRYKIDGQPNFQTGLQFSAMPDDSDFLLNFENPLAEDTNFNGIGDGAILTPAMQDFGFDIPLPSGAQTVTIQIGVYTAESAEETGFDDLRLEEITGPLVSVANALGDTDVAAGRSVTLDLAPVFQDSEGSALTYTATSGDATVATVSASDALEQLTVDGVAVGTTTIEVTASNGSGSSATDAFTIAVLPGPPNVDVDVRIARAADVCDPSVAGDCDSVVLPGLVNGAPRPDSIVVDPGTPVLVSTVITNNDSRDVTAVQIDDEKPGYTETFTTTIPAGTSEPFNRIVDAPLTPQVITSTLQATVTTADGERTGRRDAYGIDVPRPEVLMDVRIARPADLTGCDTSDLSTCTVPDPDPQDTQIPRDTVEVGVGNEVVVTYAVTNVGQSTLASYTVTDDQGTNPIATGTSLAPGATATVTRLYAAPTALGVNAFDSRVEVADAGGNVWADFDVYAFEVLRPFVTLDVRIGRASDVTGCDTSDLSTCTVPDPDPQDSSIPSDTVAVDPSESGLLITYDVTNKGLSVIQSLDILDGLYGDVLSGEPVNIAPGENFVTTRLVTAPSTPGLDPNVSPTYATGRDAGGNASIPDADTWAFDVGAPALDVDVRIALPADLTGCDTADPSTCTVVDPNDVNDNVPKDTLVVDPQAEVVVTYDVTNTGQSPLTSLTVLDPNSSGDFAFGLSADLDPGASATTTRVYSAPAAVGLTTVTAIITGTDTGGNETGNADAYGLDVPRPDVLMDVRIARPADLTGCDVSDPTTCTVPDPDPQDTQIPSDTVEVGGLETVVVTYAVTNVGQSTLASYTVTDDQGTDPITTGTSLAPGATATVTRLYAAPTALGVNAFDSRVEVADAGGNVWADFDVYGIEVMRPAVSVNALIGKASEFCSPSTPPIDLANCSISATLADGSPRPDTVQAVPGGDFYLIRYVVTNIGASTVEQVRITNDGQEVVSTTGLGLAPGQSTSLKWIGTAPVSPGLVTFVTRAIGVDGAGVESQILGGTRDVVGVQTQGIAFRLLTQVAPAVLYCEDLSDPNTCSATPRKALQSDASKIRALLAKDGSDRQVVRYRFFNAGTVAFDRHTLVDNVAGTVFSDVARTVDPLEAWDVFRIYDEVPLVGEQRAATWTARATTGEVVSESTTEVALPVELSRFVAQATGEQVTLRWTTASETNNAGFFVERAVVRADDPLLAERRPTAPAATHSAPAAAPAAEALRFETLRFVEGRGTTLEPQDYRFTDADWPYAAMRLVYRLRQVDLDGTTAYSDVVEVTLGAPAALALEAPYPNPARGDVTLRYALPQAGEATVSVYDVLGRRVVQVASGPQVAGPAERRLDTSRWPSGMYFVRLVAGGEVHTRRLTVVR